MTDENKTTQNDAATESEGRMRLLDLETGKPTPLSAIEFEPLSFGQIRDCEVSAHGIMSSDGDASEISEWKVRELGYFLETLDEARTPGELLALIQHAWHRIAVEMH